MAVEIVGRCRSSLMRTLGRSRGMVKLIVALIFFSVDDSDCFGHDVEPVSDHELTPSNGMNCSSSLCSSDYATDGHGQRKLCVTIPASSSVPYPVPTLTHPGSSPRDSQLVVQFGTFHGIFDPKFYMAFYILGLFLVTPFHFYWSFTVSLIPNTLAHTQLIPLIRLPAGCSALEDVR
jgi:hypothetical protein